MESASENYTPWYFPVVKEGKAPDVKISWKTEKARITRAEADERLAKGLNVGISGRKNDQLILLDIDDPAIESEIKPTLKIRSRSRTGTHAIYWADTDDDILPTNIPTDQGELRSSDQYLVAPGSYVPCTEEELEEKVDNGEIGEEQKKRVLNDEQRGQYTLDNYKDIAFLSFEELPQVFQDYYRKSSEKMKEIEERRKQIKHTGIGKNNKHSALFDLTIHDLAPTVKDSREPHPIHESSTGENWSVSQGVGHCWRHLVSLNAIQYLCVESGYLSCLEAGSPHKNSNAGPSKMIGDDRAIWEAWRHAKDKGYIPSDDAVPVRAIYYIIKKHCANVNKIPKNRYGAVPAQYWRYALEVIEEEY